MNPKSALGIHGSPTSRNDTRIVDHNVNFALGVNNLAHDLNDLLVVCNVERELLSTVQVIHSGDLARGRIDFASPGDKLLAAEMSNSEFPRRNAISCGEEFGTYSAKPMPPSEQPVTSTTGAI